MADPSEADLARATAAVGTLLEGMRLSARLYAVEPREGMWAVIVECATGSGWQRVELRAGPELLAVPRRRRGPGDPAGQMASASGRLQVRLTPAGPTQAHGQLSLTALLSAQTAMLHGCAPTRTNENSVCCRREVAMSHALPTLIRSCLTVALAFALAACGSVSPPKTEPPTLEQRVLELERRMEILEARPVVEPPFRSREEIQAQIKTLEQERSVLLTRYYDQHPAIRDIDRRLGILNTQLKLLE